MAETAQAISPTRLSEWVYDVFWNGAFIGAIDGVDLSGLKEVLKPIQVGSRPGVTLGHFRKALEGTIKVHFREVDKTAMQKLTAHNSGGTATANIPLLGPLVDTYTEAKALKLHPNHLAANVETEDINFLKAYPTFPLPSVVDGDTPTTIELEFHIYPDRSKEGVVYGYYGAVPA